MKVVLRNRYYCDYCKKGTGTRQSMVRHEKGCTANPQRECGMCAMKDDEPTSPLAELLAIFDGFVDETIDDPLHWSMREGHEKDRAERYTRLREKAGNCPACILAALRQTKVYIACEKFDWKKESKQWLADHSHYDDDRPY
jgi:hypothetical protein